MSNALWNMAYAHLQAENATLKAKVESLSAKLRALEGAAVELERLRKIEAIVTNPLFQRFMNEASQGLAALQNQQEKK